MMPVGAVVLLLLCPLSCYCQAPGRVTDLEVIHHNNHLTVKFTSPNTVVDKFIIKYAETAADLEGANFNNDNLVEELEQSDLTHGSMDPPTIPETLVSLHVDPFEVFEGKTQYFFAMKSESDSSQLSPLSNIANVTVDQVEDTTPPLPVTDLAVTVDNDDLTLSFTCPGDDGDSAAPVAKISIRYARNTDNINAANFHNDNMNYE